MRETGGGSVLLETLHFVFQLQFPAFDIDDFIVMAGR